MKAAVFHEAHAPLSIEDIEIDDPIGKETIVRTVASGVCGSDAHIIDGFIPGMRGPMVLGHEAAGIVDHQIDVIRSEWHATCDRAELTDFQRQVLWGRQFLNPYALYDYTAHPNLAPTRRSLAPTRPDIDLEV